MLSILLSQRLPFTAVCLMLFYLSVLSFRPNFIHRGSYKISGSGVQDLYMSTLLEKNFVSNIPTESFGTLSNLIASSQTNGPDIYGSDKKYLTLPMTYHDQSQTLTWMNKKYLDLGMNLRSKYKKLRALTEDEEKTAGKFSFMGKRLDRIRKSLEEKLQREPTIQEWSSAAGLSSKKLQLYLSLSIKARNRLVQHNIRLVDYFVRRVMQFTHWGKKASYYELITEGVVGLTRAAENYDGRSRFSPYAQVWIRSEIYRGLTKARPGYLANHKDTMFYFKANRVKSMLEGKLKRKPTDEEISEGLNVKLSTWLRIKTAATAKLISADTQLGSRDDGPNTYYDMYLKADQSNFEFENCLWKSDFNDALSCLSGTEKRAISLRYGLLDGKQKSIEKTAALMCMSVESVRKTVLTAFEKLRDRSVSDILACGPPKPEIVTTGGRLAAKVF